MMKKRMMKKRMMKKKNNEKNFEIKINIVIKFYFFTFLIFIIKNLSF